MKENNKMMKAKPLTFLFIITITLLTIIFSMQIMPEAKAATSFDVGVIVCNPLWYCTDWSESTCGTRSCVDMASCGTDHGKPEEYRICTETPPGGGGGGGSGGGGFISVNQPQQYFVLNLDIIKVEVSQGMVIQKILKVNGTISGEYKLEILYPSSYAKDAGLVTTSMDTKYIDGTGDFNIIIDARNITVGTYSVLVRISSGGYEKIVNVVMDVTPKNNILMEVRLDSNIKNLGMDTELKVYTHIEGLTIKGNENIEYTILDPKGNVMYTEEKSLNGSLNVENIIVMPRTIDEGYYAISVKILQGTDEYIKSATFSVLPIDKYHLITEEPQSGTIGSLRILGILLIIIVVMILINFILVYKKRSEDQVSKKYAHISSSPTIGSTHNESTLKTTKSSDTEKGIGKLFSSSSISKKNPQKAGLETLKNAYSRGFISLLEYRKALKDEGYVEESNKILEQEGHDTEKKTEVKISETKQEKIEEEKEEKQKNMIVDETPKIGAKNSIFFKIGEMFKKEHLKDSLNDPIKIKDSKINAPERLPELKMIDKETAGQGDIQKQQIKREAQLPLHRNENTVSGALSRAFTQNIIDKKIHEKDAFVLYGHQKIYSIRELINELPKMPEYLFQHHVIHGRNNFADWIGDVFGYFELAEELRQIKTKEDMIKILKRYDE
jgi:hypothetical protein